MRRTSSESRIDGRRVEAIYGAAEQLPPAIATALHKHRSVLETGDPITSSLNGVVGELIDRVDEAGVPPREPGWDPLPALEQLAGLVPVIGPQLPPPDEIGEEEIELRTESAHRYRLAKARGAKARAFAAVVSAAYRYRCAFCGVVLGGIDGVVSGVDAAHILAWSNYALDVPQNGIALCKLHHWAFDASIMVPVKEGDVYRVRFTELAGCIDPESRGMLGTDGFTIPNEWLPDDPAKRPSKKYLQRLYEDLELTF